MTGFFLKCIMNLQCSSEVMTMNSCLQYSSECITLVSLVCNGVQVSDTFLYYDTQPTQSQNCISAQYLAGHQPINDTIYGWYVILIFIKQLYLQVITRSRTQILRFHSAQTLFLSRHREPPVPPKLSYLWVSQTCLWWTNCNRRWLLSLKFCRSGSPSSVPFLVMQVRQVWPDDLNQFLWPPTGRTLSYHHISLLILLCPCPFTSQCCQC